ncbi:LysR family transcriptional regulator [Variovorax sp. M-6]|uniref:LysR family transcriptional regulator n=1 Tax=Variovorax sp. M-6 TaxID=3233041 RepID=UPI003F96FCBA
MDLRQLRYFVAVAEELHFGRAAQRLSITQPPLSFNIAKLEESLGFELLRRSTREVALTPAGQVMYQEALKILSLTREAQASAGRIARGESGTIHVGFVGSALLTRLTEVTRSFGMARPDVQVIVHELNSFEQVDALQLRKIDLGIIHARTLPGGIGWRVLDRQSFVCALPADHPLAARADIGLHELRNEDFVLFSRPFSPEFHDKIVAMCLRAGFTPNIRHEVRHMLSVAALVARKFGVSLVPSSLQAVVLPNLCFRPLAHSEQPSELRGIWREGDPSALVHSLLEALTPREEAVEKVPGPPGAGVA